MRALPGEDAVDRDLVDAAVRRINGAFDASSLRAVTEVGRFVLDTFFGGDVRRFRARGRRHRSFAALSDHRHLLPSRVALWRAVSVCDQVRSLPSEVATALPYTHHTLLLSLQDPAQKLSLATAAIEGRWTRRRLEAEVRAKTEGVKRSRGGRPRLLPIVRTANRLEALMEAQGALDGVDLLPALADDERRRVARILERTIARLSEIVCVGSDNGRGFTGETPASSRESDTDGTSGRLAR
ncbi:MAG: hypothetical protein KC621_29610 [Myxococcales bacterium]|nr:hypothetical protein [Myxococcales bacterium]